MEKAYEINKDSGIIAIHTYMANFMEFNNNEHFEEVLAAVGPDKLKEDLIDLLENRGAEYEDIETRRNINAFVVSMLRKL